MHNEDKIRAQLERLAGRGEFARTDRMVRFLRYVVEKTLEGDVTALRERQIGIEVFDRPSDWDPKLDNIVRSEARRLRAKLDAYAASSSPDETVRITLPKGGYSAAFQDLLTELSHRNNHLGTSTSQPAAPAVKRPVLNWRSASFLAVMLVSVVAIISLPRIHQRSAEAKSDTFEINPLSSEFGAQFSPAISPDGTHVAFVLHEEDTEPSVFITTIGGAQAQRLTNEHESALHPAWSPDAKQIAFLTRSATETDLVVKRFPNGPERIVHRLRDPLSLWSSVNSYSDCQNISWSQDGSHFVLTDSLGSAGGFGIVTIAESTGNESRITSPPGDDQDCYTKVSPDGRRIAFVRYLSHWVGDLYTVNFDGSDLRRVTTDKRDIRGVAWSPDGRRLIFAERRHGAYELRVVPSHGGESIALPSDTGSASDPSVSPTGKLVAFVEGTESWALWRARIIEGHLDSPQRFLASPGQTHSPSYSPDGKVLAFVSDRSGTPEIWFADSNGTNVKQMTSFGGPWLGSIRWSPDSSRILFDARPSGHSSIYSLLASGGKPTLVEASDRFEIRRPTWSKEPNMVYFDSARAGRPEIQKYNVLTGESHIVAPTGSLAPLESPDGSHLIFIDSEYHNLWIADPDGHNAAKLAPIRPQPELDWALCSDTIYFAADQEIWSYRFGSRSPNKLGHLDQILSPGTPSLAVSPDRNWIVYAAVDRSNSEIKLRSGTF